MATSSEIYVFKETSWRISLSSSLTKQHNRVVANHTWRSRQTFGHDTSPHATQLPDITTREYQPDCSRIVLSFDVTLLIRGAALLNLGDTIGHKRTVALPFVLDIRQYDLVVWAECRRQQRNFQFTPEHNIMAFLDCMNLENTLISLLLRVGPWRHRLWRLTFDCYVVQLK